MIVQPAEGQHDRNRQDRARQRITEVAQAHRAADSAGRRQAHGEGQQQGHGDRRQRGDAAQRQGMADQVPVALVEVETALAPEPDNQLRHGNHEGAEEHQPAPGARRQRPGAAQAVQRRAARTLAGGLGSASRVALAEQHQAYPEQQQAGQLGGAGEAVEAVPGLVDGGGEGVEVEHRYRAEVGQGFHHRQRQAGADRRPRHRQGDPQERLPGRQAENPRGFHQALALGDEGAAREQVDIGIEHQHQDQDHPAGGAYARQPQAAAEPLAQQALHRSGEIQQADEDERQDVGRDRERQHQRPVQPAPPGEFAEAGEPGQADPEQSHADADAEHQGQGVAEQARQLGIPQVAPDFPVDLQPAQQQHAERQQHQRGNGEGDGVPAAGSGMGHEILGAERTTPRSDEPGRRV